MSSDFESRIRLRLTQSEYADLLVAAENAGLSERNPFHPVFVGNAVSHGPKFGTSSPPQAEPDKKSQPPSRSTLPLDEFSTPFPKGKERLYISIYAAGIHTGVSFETSQMLLEPEIKTQLACLCERAVESFKASLKEGDY